jgi:cytochrome P450
MASWRFVSCWYMSRVTIEEVEVHGQLIRAGERVLMRYPSANRE